MINVNDELPNAYEMVWVLLEGGNSFTRAMLTFDGKWQYNWRVTHWSVEKPSKLPHLYRIINEPIDIAIKGLEELESKFKNR
ncbi:hypothetical protein [Pedobacter agri]|uniref:hypothetical protein n=1 Tax=Pedobacter agri TaxID=454586 RepID=UPI00292E0204|nr:hypothetical protein [Pedobacter agri]